LKIKLPIGIQTFKDIRDKKMNYLYIDKTDLAFDLIKSGRYFFLSRPRRFGKSLFLDTLQNIFEGNQELFKDLAIYDKWDWNIKYPVIKIVFGGTRSSKDLLMSLSKGLNDNQKKLEIKCDKNYDYATCLSDLIEKAYKKYNKKVVILIDEYDKPILDNLDNIEVASENREILRRLYTEIKNADQYLEFAMLTGVSKFSKASIFSGLNMLQDISLDKRYGNICGYTQKDIETTILPLLNGVDLKKLKIWYNGYNFLKDDVYNPFDILLFIQNDFLYDNYWFSTGTPSFLIKLIQENSYFLPKLLNLKVGKKLLDSFDIENLDIEVILYQAGYLTVEKMMINSREQIEYKLKLPNKEVTISLNDVLIDFMTSQKTEKLDFQNSIYDALYNNDLNILENSLKSMFASIPYNHYVKNNILTYEGYYASVIYIYFQSLGFEIIGEDVTNKGRIDLTIKTESFIYIIEFKVGQSNALEQIREKRYYEKYLSEDKSIYLIGINFNEEEKNISRFEWEKI